MAQYIGERFEIGELMAQGGMGDVYLGQDLLTQEPVAIKHIRAEICADDPTLLQRFEREGIALRQLNHPNVVKLLAAIQHENNHYLVMEYVNGGSLANYLEQHSKLSIDQTLQIALDVTDALIRVHR